MRLAALAYEGTKTATSYEGRSHTMTRWSKESEGKSSLWFVAYNVGLLMAFPAILLTLLAKKRCRRGLVHRLGWGITPSSLNETAAPHTGSELLWIHAVSLGEVTAAVPLVQALRVRFPKARLIVSTVTETGREAVEHRLAGVAEHRYAPLDFPWVVNRVIEGVRPKVFLCLETELWPNLLRAMARRGIPSVLVNGRLSTRSFQRYQWIVPFWRHVVGCLTVSLMQSNRDADRMRALGAQAQRVTTTGNIKFDQPIPHDCLNLARTVSDSIGLTDTERLIVAGSTHSGEEEILLDCYRQLLKEFPDLVLMMAPRHIERSNEVEEKVRTAGLHPVRRSGLEGPQSMPRAGFNPRVIILDTRGELAVAYRLAVLAFVGGTLVPVGGHNLLEPALWKKPVFYGPNTDHCAEVARLLEEGHGGCRVNNGTELVEQMSTLLREPARLTQMGEAAKQVLDINQGALDRTLEAIEDVLNAEGEEGSRVRRLRSENERGGWQQPRSLDASWVRSIFGLLLGPYALVMKVRAWCYQQGWLRSRTLPCPVISIGNLTVGGTGKTPLVIFLAGRLLRAGKRVGVLSRGYGRTSRDPFLLVSDGHSILVGPQEAGDEPYAIAQRCPTAVVAVGADRYRVGRWLLDQCSLDCLLLDDGFQHLALARDLNILVVDASDEEGLAGLFPAGRLREPLSAAARATAVIVTRVTSRDGWRKTVAPVLQQVNVKLRPSVVQFSPECVVAVPNGNRYAPAWVQGKSAIVFSGVGNPASFRTVVEGINAVVIREWVYPDHHAYSASDVEKILQAKKETGAELVVTTEKDAAKVQGWVRPDDALVAVRLGVDILQGREELEAAMDLVVG